MTREIKFRAWDEIYKEMWPFPLIGQHANQSRLQNANVHVMQFTGLKDKNGKEIWEGDVVEINGSARAAVIYSDTRAAYELDRRINLGVVAGHNLQLFATGDFTIEIIGNIYENPELLS